MDNNVTITANVIQGSSSSPDVTSGAAVQTNVVFGTPVTGNVAVGGKGDKGDTGDAATINIGTVTTVAPEAPATVTNIGTTGAAIFDFDIPQGEQGEQGDTGPGVPTGGSDDQVLRKTSGVDFATEWHTPVKADVGLGNADNTSDANKPISTATQTALDAKVTGPASVTDDLPAVFDSTTGKLIKQKTYAAFKTLLALVKGDVGLGNVDNTSDANKPVSTATQTALNLKEDIANLGNLAYEDVVTEAEITLADNTTNDFSITKHGFVPKGTNLGRFLKDDGTWTAIPGGGDMLAATYDPQTISADAFDQDNMTDGTTNKNYTATEKTKLAGIETAADVTDATNVAAAGATMDADTSLAGNGYFLDEDNMASDSATKVPSQQSVKAYVDAAITAAKAALYPVGSIYTSVNSTNPNTSLGFGTWTAFGAGRVPVGFDSGQTEFDTDEETGGAKTVTLTTAEMPSHTHVQDAHTHTQNSHTHTTTISVSGANNGMFHHTNGTTAAADGGTNGTDTSNSTTATNQNTTATNQNTGGDGAHNNLQPYIVVRMWKRTA